MPTSPNTDNYTLGKGVVYFDQLNQSSGLYEGERDLGNAPAFSFNVSLEKLEHYSSRGGLKAKDKEIISEITPAVAFTLDELNKDNIALLTLADINEVAQTAGTVSEEVVLAHLGKRSELSMRSVGTIYSLAYNGGTGDFVPGETVSGATGEGVVVAVTGTSTAGTLTILLTTAGFVDAESLTGDASGAADVSGTETVLTTKNVLVTDSTGSTVYVAGTDYEIDTALKDDSIGRIKVLSGGSITEGESLRVSFAYEPVTYYEIQAFKNSQTEGKLRFVSDNPAGEDQELVVWRVSLTPSGDTAMIGDDWSTLGFTGEILKDETGHPNSPYFNIIMN